MSGEQLRAIRKRLGMRQSDMAARLGVTRKTVAELERADEVRAVYALAAWRLLDMAEAA